MIFSNPAYGYKYYKYKLWLVSIFLWRRHCVSKGLSAECYSLQADICRVYTTAISLCRLPFAFEYESELATSFIVISREFGIPVGRSN